MERDDVILEIGTGIGTLTVELAPAVDRVVTVEVDARLEPVLAETLAPYDNITLITKDAMDLTQSDTGEIKPNKLVANLPYGVAAPVILRILALFPEVKSMLVMVQREIADRLMGRPETKDYSAFTVKAAYYCRVERVMSVSRNVFMPAPNVDSTVIRLIRHEKPPVSADREYLFALITAGFSQRRKRLANAVGAVLTDGGREAVGEALRRLGLSENVRAEVLTLDDFGRLAGELGKYWSPQP